MRYARHVVLEEVGEEGQARLLRSSALVVGAGGLGSPVLMYLAAAGVGRLGIVDFDTVDITNLQRQIVHGTEDIGRAKVESAVDRLGSINPEIEVTTHNERLVAGNALDIISRYDLVADGSDNFDTRYLINDACYFAKVPLVTAALLRYEGQLTTVKAYRDGDNPCYRCLFPNKPDRDLVPGCEQAGIFGSVAGVLGTMQATEVLKELLGSSTRAAAWRSPTSGCCHCRADGAVRATGYHASTTAVPGSACATSCSSRPRCSGCSAAGSRLAGRSRARHRCSRARRR